jgi:hypothetical protein|tara:strand:- start:549 stop:665 length:117 start_codon:yes stop_codon:yes gene_type:complete
MVSSGAKLFLLKPALQFVESKQKRQQAEFRLKEPAAVA